MAELARLARYPLCVEHLNVLLEQTRDRMELRLGEKVDIEHGARFAETIEGLRRRVIVGSRDSLLSRRRYALSAYDRVTLVMVDECHHGISARMQAMLDRFISNGATVVGFSATPYKGKGKALSWWPRPQVVYPLLQALNEGYLVPPRCWMSEAKSYDLTLVEEAAKEWKKSQLEAVLAAEQCAHEVSSLVLSTFKKQSSVVYASCVRQAEALMEMFGRYGAPVAMVHSKQNPLVRKDNMQAFMSGEAKIIVNVGILSCGWDHPELRNVYMAAPCRSLNRYEQRIGRGMRALSGVLKDGMSVEERKAAIAASDKPFFNLYDITSATSGHQLRNIWDILDAGNRRNSARRRRQTEKAQEGGVDAMELIREMDAADEAAAEELRAKRRQLVVGVSFDHKSRDPFAEPEKAGRGWRMLYGKYKGQRLAALPTDYLQWVLNSQRKETAFKSAVRREIKSRRRAS